MERSDWMMYWYWESWSRATIVSPFVGLLCIRMGLMVLSFWIWKVIWVQISSRSSVNPADWESIAVAFS